MPVKRSTVLLKASNGSMEQGEDRAKSSLFVTPKSLLPVPCFSYLTSIAG
jgi:hypothetical protein